MRSAAFRKPFVRKPIFSSDVQGLGGTVAVGAGRDRVEGTPRYFVTHRSRGGDCCWRSHEMESEEEAMAGARLLAAFVGANLIV